MSLHLQRQIGKLKKLILSMGTMVEETLDASIRSVELRDPHLATRVLDGDKKIDLIELDIEEECLHTLALHQPVAFDLRYVVAVLKMNTELERIGDLACNIAEQGQALAIEPRLAQIPFDLTGMSRRVRTMLKNSLDALVNMDPALAQTVRDTDDEVDAIHKQMYQNVKDAIRLDPDHLDQLVHMFSISRYLERIGDHAVNIAEDVIYMAKGDILRHQSARAEAQQNNAREQPAA